MQVGLYTFLIPLSQKAAFFRFDRSYPVGSAISSNVSDGIRGSVNIL